MSEIHAPGEWRARLRIHPSVFIAPGAVVVGDVTLGARASVWFNTVVRGDTAPIEVGEDSNLQDHAVVHVDEGQPARVGARVTVGHRAIVHGCVLEDDVLVGMGAVVLTGARVGAGSLVGAASLVRENQVVPPGSLVLGAPARVVGPVNEAHREAIRNGARHYAELARSYLARGFARPHPLARADAGTTGVARGPMNFLEWGQVLAVLSESPDWAADRLERHGEREWRRRAAPGRWSALDTLVHLRDADTAVHVPRLERLLAEEAPELPDVPLGDPGARPEAEGPSPAAVLEAWGLARRRLLARLAPLTRADWARIGFHAVRGPYPLGEMARAWADHDLSHRRQMAEALGELS